MMNEHTDQQLSSSVGSLRSEVSNGEWIVHIKAKQNGTEFNVQLTFPLDDAMTFLYDSTKLVVEELQRVSS